MPKQPRKSLASDYIELSRRWPIVSPDPNPRPGGRKRETLSLPPSALRNMLLPADPKQDYRIEKRARMLQENPTLILQEEIHAPLSEGRYGRRKAMAEEFTKLEPPQNSPRSSRSVPDPDDPLSCFFKLTPSRPYQPDPSAKPRLLPSASPYVPRKRDPEAPPPKAVLRDRIQEAEETLAKLGKQYREAIARKDEDTINSLHAAISQIHGRLDRLGRQLHGEWL